MQQKKAAVQLPVLKFELRWLRNKPGANEQERELDDHLNKNEHELELPDAVMDCVGDPRTQGEEEFRDTIRLQYRCEGLKMQLSRLRIEIKPDQADKDTPGECLYDLFVSDWDDIRSAIESTSQLIIINVRLRLLEDWETLMEVPERHSANDEEDQELSSDQGSPVSETNESVASVERIKLALPSRHRRQEG